MRYLGIQQGRASVAEQYASAMRKFEQNMTFLKALPLSERERAFAILTWASPVFAVVAKVVYPEVDIRQKVDALTREAMGIKSWGTASQILMHEDKKGGVGLCMPSLYLLHLHSKGAHRARRAGVRGF